MAELADIGLKDGGEVSGSTWDSSWPGSAAVTVRPSDGGGSRPGGAVRYRTTHFDICPMTSACVIFTVCLGANHAHGQEAQ
jgi:hypothetical protein